MNASVKDAAGEDKPENRSPPRGFEHVKRYWDKTSNSVAVKILPGEYYVTTSDELVVTVLGSCISACIRDPMAKVGGMNHFMLPSNAGYGGGWKTGEVSAATRYGNFAMEHMINEILKQGGQRKNMEVKIFGGGRILTQMTDIGKRNIVFVKDYLRTEGLSLVAHDVGDIYPRKVVYHPLSGRVRVKKLRALHNNTIIEREFAYMQELEKKPVEGEIDLFRE